MLKTDKYKYHIVCGISHTFTTHRYKNSDIRIKETNKLGKHTIE